MCAAVSHEIETKMNGDGSETNGREPRRSQRLTRATSVTGGETAKVCTYTIGGASGDELNESEKNDECDTSEPRANDDKTKKTGKSRRPAKARKNGTDKRGGNGH